MEARTDRDTKNRFLRFVPVRVPGECWLFTGHSNAKGYGVFSWNARDLIASRVAWLLWRGAIPDGMCVLHSCDNPPCVNPDHLWLGTKADNNADMIRKGRAITPKPFATGIDNPSCKLTAEDVMAIRVARGIATQRSLAKRFNVSANAIMKIQLGKTWKEV